MVRQFVWGVFGFLMFVNSVTASERGAGFFYDSMALSIEHFNSNHSRPLKASGPEHRFMFNALKAVNAKYPLLSEITRLGKIERLGRNDPFSSLTINLTGRSASEVDQIKAALALLTRGCTWERSIRIEESSRGYRHEVRNTTFNLTSEPCTQKSKNEIIHSVSNLGKLSREEVLGSSENSVSDALLPTANVWQDMDYVLRELKKLDALKGISSALESIPYQKARIRGEDLRLVDSNGNARFTDPFKLRYYYGWGDCSAGCIYKHEWILKLTPLSLEGEQGPAFEVEIESESGTPLPPGDRLPGHS